MARTFFPVSCRSARVATTLVVLAVPAALAAQARRSPPVVFRDLHMEGACGAATFLAPVLLASVQNELAACLGAGRNATLRVALQPGAPAQVRTDAPGAARACVARATGRLAWPRVEGRCAVRVTVVPRDARQPGM